MDSNEQRMAMGLRNVVSITSHRLIPSRPKKYVTPMLGIQLARSTNCTAGVVWSYANGRGRDAMNVITDVTKARVRRLRICSRPIMSSRMAPTSGKKVMRDRIGKPRTFPCTVIRPLLARCSRRRLEEIVQRHDHEYPH